MWCKVQIEMEDLSSICANNNNKIICETERQEQVLFVRVQYFFFMQVSCKRSYRNQIGPSIRMHALDRVYCIENIRLVKQFTNLPQITKLERK